MTALHDALVAGEPLVLLVRALSALSIEERPDGWANVRGDIPPEPGAAMHRAIMRIEAEMICEDADKLEVAGREARTSPQRRHDAFVVLAQRIGDAVVSRT
jgi:Domain of unknown function (DUF222)